MTMANCIAGFWGLECPHYTNDLCPAFVETRLVITVNCPLIVSTELFANGVGARTDFASWNAVISLVFCSERGCNLELESVDNIKRSTEKDSFCIEQCLLRINPSTTITRGKICLRHSYRVISCMNLA